MATLTNIQQNILSRIQALARLEIAAKSEATLLAGMWGNEFATMPDNETLRQYVPFAHITAEELSAGAGALVAINTTRGEFSSPTANVVKLLKIVDGGQ